VTQVHFEKKVKPTFAKVFWDREGVIGVVEFDNQDDVDLAIRMLDGTQFKNRVDRSYIRVTDDSDKRAQQSRLRSRFAIGIAGPEVLQLVMCFRHIEEQYCSHGGFEEHINPAAWSVKTISKMPACWASIVQGSFDFREKAESEP
jgi:RNA recognition motif. (a.k.a. RRM, RBD, or RNP domain)